MYQKREQKPLERIVRMLMSVALFMVLAGFTVAGWEALLVQEDLSLAMLFAACGVTIMCVLVFILASSELLFGESWK